MNNAGRQREFGSVAKSELNALYRTACRMLRDHDEAEDAVQEALDKGWRNLDRLAGDARLKPWLFRILTNTCLDTLRLRTRRPHVEFNEDDYGMQDMQHQAMPDDGLRNYELGQAINREIDRLTVEQQAVVQLVMIEQCSYEDTALALDVPVGTVRSRLSRARANLGAALDSVIVDVDTSAPSPEVTRLRLVK